jgi:membrane protease YdiL (CAAX protease family)
MVDRRQTGRGWGSTLSRQPTIGAGQLRGGVESQQHGTISRRTVVGLVVAIGAIDIVANSIVPEPARVPVKIAVLFALLLWARRAPGLAWEEMGLGRAELGAGLRLGGLTALTIAGAILLFVGVPSTQSFFEARNVAVDSTTQHILMPLVIIPVGTALFEETIFRGVLLGVLLRTMSRRQAVLVSSGLFGLWHIPPALHDGNGHGATAGLGVVLGIVLFTSVAGVFFAVLRLRSGSLAAPVLAHAATNSCAYLAALAVS